MLLKSTGSLRRKRAENSPVWGVKKKVNCISWSRYFIMLAFFISVLNGLILTFSTLAMV